MRRVLRSSALLLTALSAVAVSGCGGGSGTTDVLGGEGWRGVHSDSRNSATVQTPGERDLAFDWSRPLGGPAVASPTVASNGQIFLTARTETGCNVFSFQIASERKRWCTRLEPGTTDAAPVVDAVANSYIGDGNEMRSYTEYGQVRWRTPVLGSPVSSQFTGDGNVLVVTHLGQVQVLDPQTGFNVAPPLDLVPVTGDDVPVPAPGEGMDACFYGTDGCPVTSTPAVDLASGRIYVTVFSPGDEAPHIVALTYTGGSDAVLREDWSSDALPTGPSSNPVVSADGATLYVQDRDGALWALDTTDGSARWSHDLGYVPGSGPAVTADGLIVPAGGDEGTLTALRDAGDHAEPVWERPEVAQVGVPALTDDATGYTVVADGDGLALATFDTHTGETVSHAALPGAGGFTVGTAVGPQGQVVTATQLGEVFVFAPRDEQ
ncbi:PQQ-binding-like beta-propeller repeat protein [Rhodococcus sp. HNM0569]|uniref:outer membrane protein assembly factor BamB family protein n=1 Tax=Rhodococcus sp. HNM0569 TaxID=2716340 RepID=UPI00146F5492|nr:PQQ-binding-like beta-propeller repeat protein [Rhodococcus sp. HNM0569]NLU82048.1 PQQ-binding-like beta-propeller repeat protein [Rhodococcus sp. HNM0569]